MQLCEHSKYLIDRFDHYAESANNKANFYLAFNTFVIGAIAAGHNEILKLAVGNMEYGVKLGLIFMVVLSFLSMIFTLLSMRPHLSSGNKSDYHTLVFFKSISELSESDFEEKYTAQKEKDIERDLVKQLYQLSKILDKKYAKLKIVGWLVFGELAIFTVVVFVLILN